MIGGSDLNYFVEGLQGSGKSTMVQKLSEKYNEYKVYHEGDYSPVELAWCSYVSIDKYNEILEKYSDIRQMIEDKSVEEDSKKVISYTQILTDIPGFHKDLEQYEIYNGRIEYDEFKKIVLGRFKRWNGNDSIFECSLFQNIIEDMILFRTMSDEEIIEFYKEAAEVLRDKQFKIVYLKADDVAANLNVIRKERSDDEGNELWFPLMMGYFDNCPYAKKYGVSGEVELIKHFEHRQELEIRICKEVFPDNYSVLKSKGYDKIDF